VRSAMARARENNVTSIAFPALGTGVGGFPLEEGARITVSTVREELPATPSLNAVIFALRGATAYHVFERALAEPSTASEQPPGAIAGQSSGSVG